MINAAVFDSFMVGLARRLGKGEISNLKLVKKEYEKLLTDKDYLKAISQSTSDDKNVEYRLQEVTKRLAII